jgi:hypothetical protein
MSAVSPCLRSGGEVPFARSGDLRFELVEQRGVVAMDGIDETGEEDVRTLPGVREEVTNQARRAAVFNLPGRKRSGIKEGSAPLFALEKTLFKESIEGRHHGRVREWVAQAFGDLLNGSAAMREEHRHDLSLALAEPAIQVRTGGVSLVMARALLDEFIPVCMGGCFPACG